MFPRQLVEPIIFDKKREHTVTTLMAIIASFVTLKENKTFFRRTECYHNGKRYQGLVVVKEPSLFGAFLLTPRSVIADKSERVPLLLPAGTLNDDESYNKLYISNVVLKQSDVNRAAKCAVSSFRMTLFGFVNDMRKAERQHALSL